MKDNNQIIFIIVLIAVMLVLFSGFGIIGFGDYRMGGMMNWMFGAGFGFMWIFMLLISVLVVIVLFLLIFWLVKQLQKSGGRK